MSKTLKTLMLVFGLLVLIGLTACSRDITTVQTVDPGASLCFNCHSDQDTYLIDKQMEWSYSSHGIGNYVGYAGGRSGCADCHSGSGFEARLAGVDEVPYATPIRCFSCHAPHSNANFNLRVTDPQPLADGTTMDLGVSNLCTACHVGRRAVGETVIPAEGETLVIIDSTHWGAHHGPQGDLFMGHNGYEYAGVTYRRDVPPAHNTDQARCYGCHGNDNPAVDLGGHSFKQENDAEDLNVASCNRCHSGMTDFDYNNVQTDTEEMMVELRDLLIGLGLLDSEGGLIEDVSGTADQVGAVWNYIIVEEDRSDGVHNPDYIHDLLQASIDNLSQ